MLIVRIFFLDGTDDIRPVMDVADICLDGVSHIKVLRDERTLKKAA